MKKLIPLALLVVAVPVHAQSKAPANAAANAGTASAMAAAHNVWKGAHDNVLKSAQMMPEAKFSFKPTPEVRSFGDIIGHVAGSEFMFCAASLGAAPRPEDAIEKLKHSKADLIAALEESGKYCERAYAQSDARGGVKMPMFGNPSSVLEILILNAAHDDEHYGNLVTYLRINKMVPPSSQPAPPAKTGK